MAFHIVLPRALDSAELAAVDPGGERPRMGFAMLARELGATLHAPEDGRASWSDSLRAKLVGPESMWLLARRLAESLGPGDAVFCGSEIGGLQMAEACRATAARGRGARLCLFVHNLDRPRGRAALKLFGVASRVELLLACSSLQTAFLRRYLGLPDSRARFIWDHTDTAFFSPGAASAQLKKRPLVVSVGLEQRDYQTLALATADLDVDVRISGFSEDAAALQRTFPAVMPANMTRKFYTWPELVQLYRDADVVVVSVHENRYAAGVQSLMEAMACARPLVVTATAGLASYLDPSAMLTVPPADAAAMRAAIVTTLGDRQAAGRRAEEGRKIARQRHDIDRYVAEISSLVRGLLVTP